MKTSKTMETLRRATVLFWVAAVLAATLALSTGAGAGAADAHGVMSLTFVDQANVAQPGACAELYTAGYADYVTSFCATSTFPITRNLPAGGYVLHETQPPSAAGRVFMKSPDRTFSVAAGMTTNVTLQHDRGARVDVSAQLPDGAAATSSCFTARPLGIGAPGQIQDTACTGLDASVVLYVGAPATIVISQDSGPSGYVLAPDVHVVTQLDGHSTATLHMTVGGGSIAVEQKSASGERVTGGCYELWQSPTGGVETSYETTCDSEDAAGTDGFVRFTDLQPGRYRVQEVEAPDGYHLSPGDLFAVVGTDEVSLSQAHQPLPELVVNSR